MVRTMGKITAYFGNLAAASMDSAYCRMHYTVQAAALDILLRDAARACGLPFGNYFHHDADFTCRKGGWLRDIWNTSIGALRDKPVDTGLKERAGTMAARALPFVSAAYAASLHAPAHIVPTPETIVLAGLTNMLRPALKQVPYLQEQNDALDMIGIMMRERAATRLYDMHDSVTLLDAAYFYGMHVGRRLRSRNSNRAEAGATRRALAKAVINGQPVLLEQFEMGYARPRPDYTKSLAVII